ncbi:MAG: BNR-4 repeat-containing protein, partial [Pirellulaceae bacterium]
MTTVTRSRSFAATLLALACAASGSYAAEPRLYPIGLGWAKTKVNCVIFRHNAVCSWNDWQFAAYYDPDRNLVLAKRRLDSSTWETRVTTYRGHVQDAHNSISIALDGDGFLHLSWDHHGNKLNYCRSRAPGSLDLTEPLP